MDRILAYAVGLVVGVIILTTPWWFPTEARRMKRAGEKLEREQEAKRARAAKDAAVRALSDEELIMHMLVDLVRLQSSSDTMECSEAARRVGIPERIYVNTGPK